MRRNHLLVILGLIVLVGLIAYASKSGLGQRKVEAPAAVVSEKVQAVPEHQGHSKPGEVSSPQQEAKEEQPQAEAPTIEIPLEKQQLIGVKTVVVAAKPLEKIIRTVGRVEYDEKRLATVNTKIEGWIEKLYVDYTGRYVKKDEPLAELYSPELIATQQEFINVLRWASQGKDVKSDHINKMLSRDAQTIAESAKQRLRLWDITDEQIRKIEESGKPIRTLSLYSPVNGYVVQKMAIQGMKVMPGEKLFDIADMSSLWIIADIYEYELSLLKEGQTAKISLNSFPGKEFASKIDYIYPVLTGETRTMKVRFTIPNPGGLLRPQMFANVEVKISVGKKLAIPDDAIIDTGTRQIVYVDRGEGNFEPREVMLGVKAEGFREVLKGLKPGEKIASSATFLIDSEAQLKGVTPLSGHKH